MAVNLGEDPDSTGAICEQLAGAYFGERGIPSKWLSKLVLKDVITEMTDKLLKLSKNIILKQND